MWFELELRLETPLFLGGIDAKSCDASGALRVPAVRGLLHTWARALIRPLVQGDDRKTQDYEFRLLGAAGGDRDQIPTVRIADVTAGKMILAGASTAKTSYPASGYPISPVLTDNDHGLELHKQKSAGTDTLANRWWTSEHIHADGKKDQRALRGMRDGFVPGQMRRLRFQMRAAAWRGAHKIKPDPQRAAALLAVTWCAFAFGSLGNRCRRGYGSLTPTGLKMDERLAAQVASILGGAGFPQSLGEFADELALATQLAAGLSAARQILHTWIHPAAPLGSPPPPPPSEVFQVAGPSSVFVGECFGSCAARRMRAPGESNQPWLNPLVDLMERCHDEKIQNPAGYGRAMGSAKPRLASPLWVRVYRVQAEKKPASQQDGASGYEYVPIATFSPPPGFGWNTADGWIVYSVLNALGAAPGPVAPPSNRNAAQPIDPLRFTLARLAP